MHNREPIYLASLGWKWMMVPGPVMVGALSVWRIRVALGGVLRGPV